MRAIQYWLRATVRPRQVIAELTAQPNKVAIVFWVNLIFALLYSMTALIYYAIGRLPAIRPWIPLPEDKIYLYQALWTVPWGLPLAVPLLPEHEAQSARPLPPCRHQRQTLVMQLQPQVTITQGSYPLVS